MNDGLGIQGSGAFISPNEILTAAHVLPTTATTVIVDPGRAGNDRPFGYLTAASWTTDEDLTGKKELTAKQSSTDLGVITLSTNLGYETGWFNVASGLSASNGNITGYPNTQVGVEQTASSFLYADTSSSVIGYDPLSIAPGSSGGPVWVPGGAQATLGGVVSTGIFGPLITGASYNWVEQQIAAHAQPTEAAVTNSDFAGNAYPVAFYLDDATAEAGTGGPTPIANMVIGTSEGDSILAGPDDGSWNITEGGGDVRITWESTVGFSDVSISPYAGGVAVSGQGTTIDISQVSRMHFIDGEVQFDPSSTEAQLYRLYLAVLGRAPDPLGQEYWLDLIDNQGASLIEVANAFVTSPEYVSRYGAGQSDADFLDVVYRNVLDRAPDPSGDAYWLGQLSRGLTRAQLIVGFSESPEFKADTASDIAAGIFVVDPQAASVARLYYTAFDRAPDRSGFIYNVDQLYGRGTLNDLASQFIASTEFTTRYGNTSNQQFVDLLYQNALGRGPDTSGEQFWINQIQSGAQTRAGVVLAFSNSPEQEARLVPVIDQSGVVFLS